MLFDELANEVMAPLDVFSLLMVFWIVGEITSGLVVHAECDGRVATEPEFG